MHSVNIPCSVGYSHHEPRSVPIDRLRAQMQAQGADLGLM
jgi:hypothetical protein